MTEQIQFTGRNLTEMFRLPCVQAIIKGTDGRPILELNRAMMSDGRSACFPGQWLVGPLAGKWKVINNNFKKQAL